MTNDEKPDKRGVFKCLDPKEAYQQIQQLNDSKIRLYQKCDECKLFRKSFPDACEKYQPPKPPAAAV